MAVYQLVYQFFAQIFYIKCAVLGKVQYGLFALGAAIQTSSAAGIDFAFFALYRAAANGASLWRGVGLGVGWAVFKHE